MKSLKLKSNRIYLKLLILLGGTVAYGNAFAAKYCSTTDPTYIIALNQIEIKADDKIGDIIGKSDLISKTITCSRETPYPLVARNFKKKQSTNVFINQYGVSCEAIPSGYPGIGIAWYNYNSRAVNGWGCASNSNASNLVRGLSIDEKFDYKTEIKDQIFLVKTGSVSAGSHFFNEEFVFNEAKDTLIVDNTYDYLPDFGKLYSLYLQGNIDIYAPRCSASQKTYRESFDTKKALIPSYETNEIELAVSCDGYIENGTVVNFDVTSPTGQMAFNENYFATNLNGVGMAIKYQGQNNSFIDLNTNRKVPVVIYNNVSNIKLKLIPNIINGSGIYPVDSDKLDFKLTIKASD